MEKLNRVIDRMNIFFQHMGDVHLRYKLMIDREVYHELVNEDPEGFLEDKDFMTYRNIRMIRNDNVEGVWVQLL